SRAFFSAAFLTTASSSSWVERPSVTGSTGLMLAEFQWVRLRTWSMVALVVPRMRASWASVTSGWLRRNQAMASGRSWRRDTGVYLGAFFCGFRYSAWRLFW